MTPTDSSRTTNHTLPMDLRRHPAATAALLADAVSFGFVFAAILAVTTFDVQMTVLQVLAVMAIFGGLRYVAHELRADADRAVLAHAGRRAALLAESPNRWNVEQRDGYGRRFDSAG